MASHKTRISLGGDKCCLLFGLFIHSFLFASTQMPSLLERNTLSVPVDLSGHQYGREERCHCIELAIVHTESMSSVAFPNHDHRA